MRSNSTMVETIKENNAHLNGRAFEEDTNVLEETLLNSESTLKIKLKSMLMSPFFLGLILGGLSCGIVLAVVTSLWLTSPTSTTTTTSVFTGTTTTLSTTSVTISTATTTTSSTTSVTTSSTTTTTTAPPSFSCATTSNNVVLQNNQFIYSPTRQIYAAGMLNNQFGVYNAYGYNNVTSKTIWTASQSSTPANSFFAEQNDRNLVVYSGNGTPIWTSNTDIPGPSGAYCLYMLDSGNLIWTNATNTNAIIWQSNSTVTSG